MTNVDALFESAEFAELSGQPFVELGSYELKGITGPQRVFGEVAAGHGPDAGPRVASW